MVKSKILCASLTTSLLLALSACGGGGAASSTSTAATSGSEGGAYAGPITGTDADRGRARFAAVCAGCHADGISGIAWDAPRMRQQIREGSGQMPAIREARLSAADLENLLLHLQSTGAVTQ